ncbi:GNAT family N-acetyltransferase [Naasia lichenicola]|uniref:GNAT family N-acetyltransferase n=1 Tax=Naasia lichenicola TaxID=2565933 RepID=A0A4S4FKN2_9MICO|nr:GNAT family protein [Naasia lichenicola]THG30950.1 GNAT family N-acetyltransferase [Naasia lichenicola]
MLRLPFRPSLPLETERLLLRPLTSADTDALLAYRSDEESCRYLPFPPMDRTEIDRRLREQWGRVTFDGPEQNITLGVTLKSTGELVGDVVLFLHSPTSRTGEIGYVLHPNQVGSGYASEAATALLRVAFDELGLHRVVGRLDARNDASARVLERIGMRQEALLREDEWFKGEWSSTLIYAILEQDWAARTR